MLKINALNENTASASSFNDFGDPMSILMLQKCALKVIMFYIPTSGKIKDNLKTLAAIYNHPVFLALVVDLFHSCHYLYLRRWNDIIYVWKVNGCFQPIGMRWGKK